MNKMTDENLLTLTPAQTKSYSFHERITTIEEKAGDTYLVVPISTVEKDSVDDIVTEECLLDMKAQIDAGNIKLDIDHEVWRGDDDARLQPIGRAVKSWIEDGKLFVKWLLNKTHPRFNDIVQQVKDKFYDAASIAFRPAEAVKDAISGIRYLKRIILENVGLTAYPINTGCSGAEVLTKSLKEMTEKGKASKKFKKEAMKPEEPEEDEEEEEKGCPGKKKKKMAEAKAMKTTSNPIKTGENRMDDEKPEETPEATPKADEGQEPQKPTEQPAPESPQETPPATSKEEGAETKAVMDELKSIRKQLEGEKDESLTSQLKSIEERILELPQFKHVAEAKAKDEQDAKIEELKTQIKSLQTIINEPAKTQVSGTMPES